MWSNNLVKGVDAARAQQRYDRHADGLDLISSSPSFDTEKFQLPRLPIVAR